MPEPSPGLDYNNAMNCATKKQFRSEHAAKRTARFLDRCRVPNAEDLVAYQCAACHYWHLGNRTETAVAEVARKQRFRRPLPEGYDNA